MGQVTKVGLSWNLVLLSNDKNQVTRQSHLHNLTHMLVPGYILSWTIYNPDDNITRTNEQLIQYIPRNMHTVFALLCFVVVIHWLIFPYPSGLLHWYCGNLTIAPVPAKQPWWIWINTSCEFIMNDCIATTKQSTTKPCAYFLGYTVPLFHHLTLTQWLIVHIYNLMMVIRCNTNNTKIIKIYYKEYAWS